MNKFCERNHCAIRIEINNLFFKCVVLIAILVNLGYIEPIDLSNALSFTSTHQEKIYGPKGLVQLNL